MRYRRTSVDGGSLRGSPSQSFVQSWHSSDPQLRAASRQRARAMTKLESVLERIDDYNGEDADLGRFGSVLRIPESKAGAVLDATELRQLPCELRSASRDISNTIARLKSGEAVHPIECNVNVTEALLDRLDDLQPSLAKLAGSNENIGTEPAPAIKAPGLSVLSQASVDSLASCDLPPGMAYSGCSSPTEENLLSPPPRLPGKQRTAPVRSIPRPKIFKPF
ncbi:hypothetical protein D9O50_06895 [Oxalobacteraceae bacterium CAVE-383]|nr:hypothetical protein D9O50_06895 [Oxalobacteraceae bacterium CAVE-383]